MNRREFSKSLAILPAGAALASLPLIPKRALGQDTLDVAAINNAISTMNASITRVVNKEAIAGDYQVISGQIGSIITTLNAGNFDSGAKEAFSYLYSSYRGPTVAAVTPNNFAQTAYNALQPYSSNISLSKLQSFAANMQLFKYPPTMSPSQGAQFVQTNIVASLKTLSTDGVIMFIADAQSYIESFPPNPVPGSAICQEIEFSLNWLGLALTTLAVMCAFPEPAIVFICPAMTAIGIIYGIIYALADLFCS